jgi:hypothetical protein
LVSDAGLRSVLRAIDRLSPLVGLAVIAHWVLGTRSGLLAGAKRQIRLIVYVSVLWFSLGSVDLYVVSAV